MGSGSSACWSRAARVRSALQHAVLGQDLLLALDEGQFGAALCGEVLDEAVHLDGSALGVRHDLGDHPQMADLVGGPDPERDVELPPGAHEFPHGPGQHRGVLGQRELRQVGEADRAERGIPVQDGEGLRGPTALVGDQVPVRPAQVAQPLHVRQPLLLTVRGVVPDPGDDQGAAQPGRVHGVRGEFGGTVHDLLVRERLALERLSRGQRPQAAVPHRLVRHAREALQDPPAEQLPAGAARHVDRLRGGGVDAVVLDLARGAAQGRQQHRRTGQRVEHRLRGRGTGTVLLPGGEGPQPAGAQPGDGPQQLPGRRRERSAPRAQDPDADLGAVPGRHRQPGTGQPALGRVPDEQALLPVRLEVLQPAGLPGPERLERGDAAQRRYLGPLGGQGVVDARVTDQFETSRRQGPEDHERVGVDVRRELFQEAAGQVMGCGDVDEGLAEAAEGGEAVARVGHAPADGYAGAHPVRRGAGRPGDRGQGRGGQLTAGAGLRSGAGQRGHQGAQGDPALLQQGAVTGLGPLEQVLAGGVRAAPGQGHERTLGPLQYRRGGGLVPQPVHLRTLPGHDLGQRGHVGRGAGVGSAGGLARHGLSIAQTRPADCGVVRTHRTHW